jgi:hypothetical protein
LPKVFSDPRYSQIPPIPPLKKGDLRTSKEKEFMATAITRTKNPIGPTDQIHSGEFLANAHWAILLKVP